MDAAQMEEAWLEARKQRLHNWKDKAEEVAIARRGAAHEVPEPKKPHPPCSGPYKPQKQASGALEEAGAFGFEGSLDPDCGMAGRFGFGR